MLKADTFYLRTVSEADLPVLIQHLGNNANRGDYYPQDIHSETEIRRRFHEDGLWSKDHGTLFIVTKEGNVIGHIAFFKPIGYWNAYEIAYILYDEKDRGKGITTEATRLLVRYLFETKTVNRVQLCIHPENVASRRVAEKLGFTHEGTARGAWFHRGQHQDLEIYSILRSEVVESP
jgi:[ribosomal protein S5]-alanine N-acetyltransferase